MGEKSEAQCFGVSGTQYIGQSAAMIEQQHRHKVELARLALDAYRDPDEQNGQIITEDECRAVVLAALGLPSEPERVSVELSVNAAEGTPVDFNIRRYS